MSNLAKLGIAVAMAVIAAVLNMVYLASRTPTKDYLALEDSAEKIKAGQQFPMDEDSYKKISVSEKDARLATILVPFDQRALVFGLRASRDFEGGDPIFLRDIQEDIPRYETLGPFTLLSVDGNFTGAVETSQSGGGSSAITVEPIWEKDATGAQPGSSKAYGEPTRRLLQIIDAQRDNDAPSHLRIVALEPWPASGDNQPPPSEGPEGEATPIELIRETERGLIVPIDAVATIPRVLQIGSKIGFVIPVYP